MELPKATRDRMIGSIRRFAQEEMEVEMGDLKASLLLDFVLEEIAPSVYNHAVADAQKHILARVEEMDANVRLPEFAYWRR